MEPWEAEIFRERFCLIYVHIGLVQPKSKNPKNISRFTKIRRALRNLSEDVMLFGRVLNLTGKKEKIYHIYHGL